MRLQRIIDDLYQEIDQEEKVASFLESRRFLMPEGSLANFSRNDNYYFVQKVYVDGQQKSILLDESNEEHRRIIKLLKEKKTIVHGLPILRKNIKAMKKCAGLLVPYSPTCFEYGEELGRKHFLEDEVCFSEWSKKPECQNPWHPENRIHQLKRGIKVRSKSEVLIGDSLSDYNIISKYETKLIIGKRVFYPDFELFHHRKRKLVWWEHLGLVDDPKYAYDSLEKIDYFAANGIVPGRNLIITYETKDRPLTHEMIDNKLQQFRFIT